METSAFTQKNSIKILTCNVKDVEDYELLASEVFRISIPVVCFQECPLDSLKREKLTRSFKARGYTGVRFSECRDVIFIRSDAVPIKKEYINFTNTDQRRGVIVYTYHIVSKVKVDTPAGELGDDIHIKICTGQLESGGTGGGIRRSQIRDLNAMLQSEIKNTLIIFAGDTNICSWQTELNSLTPASWLDAWREKGTADNEYTLLFDRMDRVWWYSDNNAFRCTSYELFFPFMGAIRKGIIVEFSFE